MEHTVGIPIENSAEVSRKAHLKEFTKETTFHGLRFIAERRYHPIRRFLWILIVLCSVVAFVYVITDRALYLRTYPKAVNLDVVYAKELELPTLTVCNQNFFRRTKTFEMGSYDKVEERFKHGVIQETKRNPDASCEEGFIRVEGKYFRGQALNQHTFRSVSLSVCKELCIKRYDFVCNTVIYDRRDRSCLISPRSNDTEYFHHMLSMHQRKRCNGLKKSLCTFDDDDCPLRKKFQNQGIFDELRTSGPPGLGPNRDHTTGTGKYLVPNYGLFSMESSYIEAQEELCLEFLMYGKPSSLSVFQTFADVFRDRESFTVTGTDGSSWQREFIQLGTGVFQLEFSFYSDEFVAIDDVVYGPCKDFVSECRWDEPGKSYLGHQSVTSSGEQCMPWVEVNNRLGISIPPQLRIAGSYCRNFRNDVKGPGCFTANFTYEHCDIPYCDCKENEFQCRSGLCINKLATCDLQNDCPDGDDETEGCTTSPSCDFEQAFSCGYQNMSSTFTNANTWQRYSGQMRNGHTDTDGSRFWGGHYLYLDSSSVTMYQHQRVSILSPSVHVTNGSSPFCLHLATYTVKDILFPEAMGTINIYQHFGKYDQRRLMVIEGTDAEENTWVDYAINIPMTSEPFRLHLEAEFGESFYSDMGLDNMKLSEGTCQETRPDCAGDFACWNFPFCIKPEKVCDGHRDCLDNADEDPHLCAHLTSLACEFDHPYMCGYVDESNPNVNGWSSSPTGPSIILVEDAMAKYFTKRLATPFVPMTDAQCLSMHYTISLKTGDCTVLVYQELSDSRNLRHIISVDNNVRNDAMVSYLTLPYEESNGRVGIETNCSQGANGLSYEITQIRTDQSSCEDLFGSRPAICDFKSEGSCGYYDISKGSLHWWPTNEGLQVKQTTSNHATEIEAQLLTPYISSNTSDCIAYTLSVLGSGPIGLKVENFSQERELVWGQWFNADKSKEVKVPILLFPGTQRFILSVVMSRPGEVLLQRAELMDHLQCKNALFNCSPHTFVFVCDDGHCIPQEKQCDGKRDCWHEEDEIRNCLPRTNAHGRNIQDDLPNYSPEYISDAGTTEVVGPNSEWDMSEFYMKAGHQADDLIYSCTFAGERCSAENFSSEITDYGFCHTLSRVQKDNQPLKSGNTGATAGLRLVLNIEQYEYMMGPHSDAGVKIFLYNQEEVPFVRDLGFAVGPGEHALVGVTLSQSSALGKPWGNCAVGLMENGKNYTYSGCIRECETISMQKACGCRDAYMPGYQGCPVCNLTRYLECVSTQSELVSTSMENCDCIEPCQRKIYETRLSYASLSSLSVSQVLTSDLDLLDQRNKAALETRSRTLPSMFLPQLTQPSRISKAYNNLLQFSTDKAWGRESSIFKDVDVSLCLFTSAVIGGDVGKSILGRHIEYEKVFQMAYGRVRKTIQWHMQALLVEFEVLLRSLDSKMLFDRSMNNNETIKRIMVMVETLEESVKVYYNASRTSKSVFTSSNLTLGESITSKLPENLNIGNDSCADFVQELVERSIPRGRLVLNNLINQKQDLVGDQNLREIFDALLEIENDMEHVNNCLNDYMNFLHDMKEEAREISTILEEHKSSLILCPESATVDDILDYIDESRNIRNFSGNIENIVSKMSTEATSTLIAKTFNGDAIIEAVVELEGFVSRIEGRLVERSRERITKLRNDATEIYLELLEKELLHSRYMGQRYEQDNILSLDIWRRPQVDHDMMKHTLEYAQDTFRFVLSDRFVSHQATKVMSELIGWYMRPLEELVNSFELNIRGQQARIKDMLETAKRDFKSFEDQLILGENFVRQNFLAVDVYFAQLKYQHIEQIKAYQVESFFSDVGGFMGLLVGGSIITLFEFLDLIIFKLFPSGCFKRKNKFHKKHGTPV